MEENIIPKKHLSITPEFMLIIGDSRWVYR